MVLALKAKGIKFKTINDVRPKTTAHILSTGHHIREKEAVPLGDLQALKDGKDFRPARPEAPSWHASYDFRWALKKETIRRRASWADGSW